MRTALIAFVLCSCAVTAGAQTPSPAAPPAQTPPAAAAPQLAEKPAAPAVPAPPSETYTYDPSGRRDPFLSLIGGGLETRQQQGKRPDGSTGLAVSEISVRGVMQSRGALIAMVQGPDNKTYVMHSGDKLVDGTVKTVTPQGLVIVQEVNDPLSLVKQREIRKLLRSFEDGKQ